jgi:DNA-binding transcriptional LysR family regulator
LEKKYVNHAMNMTKSTRKTAELLNISQSTVVRRLKEIQTESNDSNRIT